MTSRKTNIGLQSSDRLLLATYFITCSEESVKLLFYCQKLRSIQESESFSEEIFVSQADILVCSRHPWNIEEDVEM